ncbi:putative UPF0481 protein At3g02645 [Solanum dulcamara]|uniref:putative UPF0481 protein At3g02645 n=1 Tax=Solanum dulcamara TaxID=45834 RepID=UPI0024869D5A|nr:putative UPF0481 protein At3g02645 [Solanum dulcamara]
MAHSIAITSIDNQIPLLQTEKDEIEEGRKVDHIIDLKDLDNLSIKSCTIFKVNVWLRESNPDAYTPKMVSIGPYHKKNPQLDSMEKYKKLYLRRFLQRKEGLDVKSCISEMVKLKKDALECYDDMKDLDTKMLLLDCCFVVEFIRERCQMHPEDYIWHINGDFIFRDLMLLENQLPFFVLHQLYLMTKQGDDKPLEELVSDWFGSVIGFPVHYECIENIKHLLHLLHKYSCQGITKKTCLGNTKKETNKYKIWLHKYSCQGITKKICLGNTKKEPNKYKIWQMPNATELSEAGVSFSENSNMKSLFDIKFERGLMTIPCLQVDDDTETILRNLIAYEQQSSGVHPIYFCDYAIFMDQLINSDKDVNLLRQEGIIENLLGEDKQVASLFNKIGNGVTMNQDVFYYKEEFKKAVDHCKNPWNKMMANLKQNYFSSPWVGASTVAVIILLILTAIQTILAFTGSVK